MCSNYKSLGRHTPSVDEIRLIRDPGAIRVVSEPTRRKILSLLRVKGMTASEIAGILEKDPSTVYRHLDKLQEAALVLPTGERKTHHIPEKVYTRTARVFLVAPDLSADVEGVDLGRLYGREEVARMLRVLQRMGHVQEGDPDLVPQLRRLLLRIDSAVRGELEAVRSEEPLEIHTLWRLEMLLLLLRERRDEAFRAEVEAVLGRLV